MSHEKPFLVEKELVSLLLFLLEELSRERQRQINLVFMRGIAVMLGSSYKEKTRIVFSNDAVSKMFETDF
tara:strand:- start:2353 stop:2562 length:210 start_codon:yes stop_codon:yes gene_type:complete